MGHKNEFLRISDRSLSFDTFSVFLFQWKKDHCFNFQFFRILFFSNCFSTPHLWYIYIFFCKLRVWRIRRKTRRYTALSSLMSCVELFVKSLNALKIRKLWKPRYIVVFCVYIFFLLREIIITVMDLVEVSLPVEDDVLILIHTPIKKYINYSLCFLLTLYSLPLQLWLASDLECVISFLRKWEPHSSSMIDGVSNLSWTYEWGVVSDGQDGKEGKDIGKTKQACLAERWCVQFLRNEFI